VYIKLFCADLLDATDYVLGLGIAHMTSEGSIHSYFYGNREIVNLVICFFHRLFFSLRFTKKKSQNILYWSRKYQPRLSADYNLA